MTDNKDEGLEPSGEQGQPQPPAESKRGAMRYQDAETTTPRPPTLAEQRAMRRALDEQQQHEQTELAEAARKSLRRRRVMIGSGVTVGIVATVAIWYAAVTPDEVNAYCVDDSSTLSSDENVCSDDYVRSHNGYSSGGFWFIPIGNGQYRSYHYNYGGNVSGTGPNRRVTGGSTAAPSGNTTVKSGTSGKTVQRGGFGVSGGGKSGGS